LAFILGTKKRNQIGTAIVDDDDGDELC